MKLEDVRALAATLPARHIHGEDGTPYLSRYRVHGWTQTMVLAGGYEEERAWVGDDGSLRRLPNKTLLEGDANRMGQGSIHRIVRLIGETWTLFVVGPKATSWGFYVEGRGMVPWRERLAERGIRPDYPADERERQLQAKGLGQ